ncbi:MAG: hypothetical protein NXH94_05805 [Rhodobacteraceae bacterium]|nr:hypothetical protein [Paracoccaceae bacterium]
MNQKDGQNGTNEHIGNWRGRELQHVFKALAAFVTCSVRHWSLRRFFRPIRPGIAFCWQSVSDRKN